MHTKLAPFRIIPLALVLLLATAFTGVALHRSGRLSAAAEEPAQEFAPYLRREDGRAADPVNLILAGELDTAAVAQRLRGVLRWAPIAGSPMAFTERGALRWTEVQIGTALTGGVRYHMRIAGAAAPSERWGRYTLAAVHRDDPVPCGHLGAAYDETRNMIAQMMQQAGHRVSWVWLGNDGPVEHCNGRTTHGDGWAAVIELRAER